MTVHRAVLIHVFGAHQPARAHPQARGLLAGLTDELGAGTDPQEGSALARAVLTYLLERRITNIVATHYPELKSFAHATKGVINASLEFDLDTLKPTYHLILGLPGRSNALAIAERLGLAKAIVDDARAELNPTNLRAEDLLDEIHRQRDLTRANYEASENIRRELEDQRAKLNTRLNQIEEEQADPGKSPAKSGRGSGNLTFRVERTAPRNAEKERTAGRVGTNSSEAGAGGGTPEASGS